MALKDYVKGKINKWELEDSDPEIYHVIEDKSNRGQSVIKLGFNDDKFWEKVGLHEDDVWFMKMLKSDYSDYEFEYGDKLDLGSKGIKYFKEYDGDKIIVVDSKSDLKTSKGSSTYPSSVKKVLNKKYADGGGVEKSYNNPENATHVLHIDGQNWYLEKIDSTHFYMSNDRNFRGMAHHIGQHKGEPYYEEVREWLKSTYAKGGGVSEFWTEINESTLYERLPYDLGVVNEDEDLISGNIWIKFRKSPMEMPSYELKRAISEDFEYFGYGNQEPPKRVSLMDGSWGSFYIHVENLTLNEIMTLLLELPEQVQERLEERKIKGYKDLGLDTYGQSLDLRISQSSDDDDYEYADGGGVGELPSNLKKRLETANKILKKYNGRELTEKEAIRFNIDHNSQSGFQAGEEAFNLAGVNTLKNNPTTREYHTIGDALIDISRKMTGVEYDLKEYQIQEILKSK